MPTLRSIASLLWVRAALLAFGLLLRAVSRADEASPASEPWQVTIRTAEQGLPNNSVECLYQTRDGFLWVGTREGLARFDGVRFEVFAGATPGFTDDACVDLAEDGDGGLWIATKRGLYRRQSGRFRRFSIREGLPDDSVRQVQAGVDGRIWAATAGGVAEWVGEGFRGFPFTVTNVEPDGRRMVARNVECLAFDGTGRWWEGASDGLARVSPGGHPRERVWSESSATNNTILSTVRCVVAEAGGAVWFGTDRMVVRKEGGRVVEYRFPEAQGDVRLRRMRRDGEFRWWIVRAGEVYRVGAEDGVLERWEEPKGVSDRYVTDVLHDGEGNTWIGTRFGGLWQLRRSRVRTLSTADGLPHNSVRSVAPARGGGVWVATAGGAARVRGGKGERPAVAGARPAQGTSLAVEDSAGRLWLSDMHGAGACYEAEGGMYRVRGGAAHCGGALAAVEEPPARMWFGLENRLLCAVTEVGRHFPLSRIDAAAGSNWVEWWGLRGDEVVVDRGSERLEMDPSGWRYRNVADGVRTVDASAFSRELAAVSPLPLRGGLPAGDIRCLGLDREGGLWVGMRPGGLHRITTSGWQSFGGEGHPAGAEIACLHVDRDGVVWTGSAVGVARYREGRWASLGLREGLPDARIQNIQTDERGDLWLATGRGLFRVGRTDLDRVLEGAAARFEGLLLGERDGMLTSDAGGTSQPGSCRSADGLLWFATAQGLVVVDPARVRKDAHPPPVYVDGIRAGSVVDAGLTGAVVLPPGGGRQVEIAYTAASYVAPERIDFRYRLGGHDREWVEAGNRRVAYYTNLRPGRYRFEVRARNHDGVESPAAAGLELVIRPWLWQTRGFGVGAFALVLAGVVAVHRARLRAIRAAERAALARSLHDQLAGKLAALVKLAGGAVAEGTGGAGGAGEGLGWARRSGAGAEGLVELAQGALRTLRRTISLSDPASDHLPGLVHQVIQVAEETILPLSFRLRLDVPVEVPARPVSARVREQVVLIASEAVNNVVKHSGGSGVRLRIRFEPVPLVLEIEDDGRGFRSGAGSNGGEGGVAGMRRRAASIGGRCEIRSEPGSGTTVRLEVRRL
jgi:ligand-binding sensor domain-containing protein